MLRVWCLENQTSKAKSFDDHFNLKLRRLKMPVKPRIFFATLLISDKTVRRMRVNIAG